MMRPVLILLAVLGLSAGAIAQLWTLTPADFQRQDGIIERLTPSGVEMRGGVTTQWNDIVLLEQHAARAMRSDEPFVLYTRDGQKLLGAPLKMDDESITWKSNLAGEVKFPIQEVRGWAAAGAQLPPESAQEDNVILQNGDVLGGIIEGTEEGVSLVRRDVSTNLKWDAIRAISLAKTAEPLPARTGLRVQITDGSVLLASSLSIEGDRLIIAKGDAKRGIPLAQVKAIQNVSGRVRFWTTLEPQEVKYTPYTLLSESVPEPSTLLEEVTVGGQSFSDVIQLRPRASLSIASPVAGKLHLQYAAGHPGRFTSMSLRITVGGSVIHEAKGIHEEQPSPAVEAPVREGGSRSC